jgi:hypothetical protein
MGCSVPSERDMRQANAVRRFGWKGVRLSAKLKLGTVGSAVD